jgi:hypothetical protein
LMSDTRASILASIASHRALSTPSTERLIFSPTGCNSLSHHSIAKTKDSQ